MKKNTSDTRTFIQFLNDYVSMNLEPHGSVEFNYKLSGNKPEVSIKVGSGNYEDITAFLPEQPYEVPKDYSGEATRPNEEPVGFDSWSEFLGTNSGGATYFLNAICSAQRARLTVNGNQV